MRPPPVAHHDDGSKARLLVAAVTAVALVSSAGAGLVVRRVAGSPVLGLAGFAGALGWWFFRVVGGASGLSRAVATGRSSMRIPLAKGEWKPPLVRCVFVSDTHNRHQHLSGKLPAGDVLIHCGDMTMNGTLDELRAVAAWFESLRSWYKAIVVTPGNHDFALDRSSSDFEDACKILSPVCHLLIDAEVTVCGLRIYGSPWTQPIPRRPPMAYQVEDIASKWFNVPSGVDILITHGPPRGHLDRILLGYNVGSEDLTREVHERIRPRIHAFGHIHEGYGTEQSPDGILFVNAAISNLLYRPSHAAPCFDVKASRL